MLTALAVRLLPLALLAAPALGDVVTLAPAADNMLYEVPLGNVSNGAGMHLFTGLTGSDSARRALVRFDVSGALPAGAVVTSVELRLRMSKSLVTTAESTSLHRVLASWGEGPSDAAEEEGAGAFAATGDATWRDRFFPSTPWATLGGDFEPAPSAAIPVGPVGSYVWGSTRAMVDDVQLWLDEPDANHGWVLRGDEAAVVSTSKRFDSRENPDPSARPELTITFDAPAPPGPPAPEVPALGAAGVAVLAGVLAALGARRL